MPAPKRRRSNTNASSATECAPDNAACLRDYKDCNHDGSCDNAMDVNNACPKPNATTAAPKKPCYQELPACPANINLGEKDCETKKLSLQAINAMVGIRLIKLKRNAPMIIKNVINNPHNLLLIQNELSQSKPLLIEQHVLEQIIEAKSKDKKYKLIFQISTGGNYKTVLNSWLKLIMLHHLKYHVYTRLTKGTHGVAIQAIKDIPIGARVFENTAGPCSLYYPISIKEKDDFNVHIKDTAASLDPTKELLNDFYLSLLSTGVEYPVPVLGPNTIDMSFFLNHDYDGNIAIENTKNTEKCDMSSYITVKPINKKTLLTINYAEFALESEHISKEKVENLVNRMQFLVDLEPFTGKFTKTVDGFKLNAVNLHKDNWIPKTKPQSSVPTQATAP